MATFDIDQAIELVEEAIKDQPKAAMFELAEDGFDSVFQQLVACILSIRTRDEVSLPTARRLFERTPTPAEMLELSDDELADLISPSSFHENKVGQIQAIVRSAVEDYDDELPCDDEILLAFRGVGPKCANLTLGIACGLPPDQRRCPRSPRHQPLGLCRHK